MSGRSGRGRRAAVDAPAKVNLFLRVLAREEGGYHRIETLFQSIDWGDRVHVEPTEEDTLELEVEGAAPSAPEENLAARAADRFVQAVGWPRGVRISLEKRIPPGAGLGGGSSDAAAVLRCLSALAPEPPTADVLLEVARGLGADVPFFLAGSPLCLGWGRGDRLLPLEPLPAAGIVLVLPDLHVATADAYAELGRELPPESARVLPGPGTLDWEAVGLLAENDFERVVLGGRPALGRLRDGLEAAGARPARLSGSGGALFGVFAPTSGTGETGSDPSGGLAESAAEEAAEEAASALEAELPEGWSLVVGRTRTAPPPVRIEGGGGG